MQEKIYSSKWSAIGSLGAKSTSVTIHTKADGEFKVCTDLFMMTSFGKKKLVAVVTRSNDPGIADERVPRVVLVA